MAGLGGRIMESGHFAEALPMAHLGPEVEWRVFAAVKEQQTFARLCAQGTFAPRGVR